MNRKFGLVQDEYSLLKQKLASGRVTREEFAAALGDPTVQDLHGRVWTLDDTGHWHIDQEGNGEKTASQESIGGPLEPAATGSCRKWLGRALLLLVILSLCSIDAVGLAMASNRGLIQWGSLGDLFSSGRLAVLVPKASLTAGAGSGNATPALKAVGSGAPASAPSATPHLKTPPAAAPTVVPASPTPNPPVTAVPALYVIGLRPDPQSPRRGQDVSFFVTFVNTTNIPLTYRWAVYLFKPDQPAHSFGQTGPHVAVIPPGTQEIRTPTTWSLTGHGPCENFLVRAGWVNGTDQVMYFTRPDGELFEQTLTVC